MYAEEAARLLREMDEASEAGAPTYQRKNTKEGALIRLRWGNKLAYDETIIYKSGSNTIRYTGGEPMVLETFSQEYQEERAESALIQRIEESLPQNLGKIPPAVELNPATGKYESYRTHIMRAEQGTLEEISQALRVFEIILRKKFNKRAVKNPIEKR